MLSSKWVYQNYLPTKILSFEDAKCPPKLVNMIDQHGEQGLTADDLSTAIDVPTTEEQYYVLRPQVAELRPLSGGMPAPGWRTGGPRVAEIRPLRGGTPDSGWRSSGPRVADFRPLSGGTPSPGWRSSGPCLDPTPPHL